MIKNRVMMHALMMGAMAYSMASKKDGDTNGAPAEADPVAVDPVGAPESATPVADDPSASVAAADPVLTDDGSIQAVTEINESNLPPAAEPHPVGGVLEEIESAISNFAHELSAEFKSVAASLIAKAKELV